MDIQTLQAFLTSTKGEQHFLVHLRENLPDAEMIEAVGQCKEIGFSKTISLMRWQGKYWTMQGLCDLNELMDELQDSLLNFVSNQRNQDFKRSLSFSLRTTTEAEVEMLVHRSMKIDMEIEVTSRMFKQTPNRQTVYQWLETLNHFQQRSQLDGLFPEANHPSSQSKIRI